ncbi:MAG: type II toxin-antitoxin system HicA family toxin [Firmicutes bacterium]|jgi:predicted RNA binding protein YcfA (HicA-like mRNA interferase family)|nr:type II toxin-antitoxin system HicA family toxin [Bacillota bacterium]
MTAPEVLRKLKTLGFVVDHVSGSHYILIGPQHQRTVVPFHGSHDLRRGTLRAIIKQAGVTEDEFRQL